MKPKTYAVADLFCGAGGSSTGAQKAIEEIGGKMELVAVNHWNIAIKRAVARVARVEERRIKMPLEVFA